MAGAVPDRVPPQAPADPEVEHLELLDAPPLTLLQILDQALVSNPEVGMALAREEQARWFFRESQAYKYPIVDVITDFGPEYNRPATNTSDNEDVTPGRSLTFPELSLQSRDAFPAPWLDALRSAELLPPATPLRHTANDLYETSGYDQGSHLHYRTCLWLVDYIQGQSP